MEERANRVRIANIPIPEADKEVPWAIPRGCVWFTLQTRDGNTLRVATEANKVGPSESPFLTIKSDNAWDERSFQVDLRRGLQLFFACAEAPETVEVIMGVNDEEERHKYEDAGGED